MPSSSNPNPRVYFQTLGCPKNDADSRCLGRRLAEVGASVAGDPSEATHVVVNTCGFIQDAKEESLEAILRVCADNPGKRVLVMGCLVERYRDELARGIPEVSDWFGVIGEDMTRKLLGVVVGETGTRQKAVFSATGAVTGGAPSARFLVSKGHTSQYPLRRSCAKRTPV
jgi:tRNA A37 methylthiotransferase MiaB